MRPCGSISPGQNFESSPGAYSVRSHAARHGSFAQTIAWDFSMFYDLPVEYLRTVVRHCSPVAGPDAVPAIIPFDVFTSSPVAQIWNSYASSNSMFGLTPASCQHLECDWRR